MLFGSVRAFAPRVFGRTGCLIGVLFGSVCVLALFGVLGANAVATWLEREVEQPMVYNHKAHVEKFKIDCVQCHVGAKTSAHATIPNIEVCGKICHRPEMPALTESPEEEKLRRYLAEGKQIPWVKVYYVEPHVFFSHARHTTLAKMECEQCHGNVGEMTTSVEKQAVPIVMEHCMECHEQNGVDNDCVLCHR